MKAILNDKVKELIKIKSIEIKKNKRNEIHDFIDKANLNLKGVYTELKAKNNFKEDINNYINNYDETNYYSELLLIKLRQFLLLIID